MSQVYLGTIPSATPSFVTRLRVTWSELLLVLETGEMADTTQWGALLPMVPRR